MLFRFSLYGFLKNQTYFEPFLVLYFLERGLSFTEIGFAIAVREFIANLMQIPTGALADVYGRRRCMIASFVVYIISFLLLSAGHEYWQILLGISFFGSGDAFRGGTHKAMILDWLRSQGRENERTKVYGFTRSWSKIGSAVSVVIGASLVFITTSYQYIFLSAVIPYVLNLANLATYPPFLDGNRKADASLNTVMRHVWRVGRMALQTSTLRRLVGESMGFGGSYEAVKDYLQPLLRIVALGIPLSIALPDKQRSALLIGTVYFILHLVASYSSRQAHRFSGMFGDDDERASRHLWQIAAVVYGLLLLLLYWRWDWMAALIFMVLAAAQNVWRPLLISRLDAHSDPADGATLLSVESQASSLATLALAPALGWAVDTVNKGHSPGMQTGLWPVALAGLLPALLVVCATFARRENGTIAL